VKTDAISEKIDETFAEIGKTCGAIYDLAQAQVKLPETVVTFDKTGAISEKTTGPSGMTDKIVVQIGKICDTTWQVATATDAKPAW
jgi:hypothetical protein